MDEESGFTDDIDDPIVVDEDHGNDTDKTAMTNTAQTKAKGWSKKNLTNFLFCKFLGYL